MFVDVVLMNGGTIRSDDVYGPGLFTIRDLLQIFPFEDMVVVVRVNGKIEDLFFACLFLYAHFSFFLMLKCASVIACDCCVCACVFFL